MTIKHFSFLAILTLSFGLGNCSSSETVEPAPSEEKKPQFEEPTPDTTANSNSRNYNIDPTEQINSTLREYRYPDGKRRKGFTYKKADVLKEDFNI